MCVCVCIRPCVCVCACVLCRLFDDPGALGRLAKPESRAHSRQGEEHCRTGATHDVHRRDLHWYSTRRCARLHQPNQTGKSSLCSNTLLPFNILQSVHCNWSLRKDGSSSRSHRALSILLLNELFEIDFTVKSLSISTLDTTRFYSTTTPHRCALQPTVLDNNLDMAKCCCLPLKTFLNSPNLRTASCFGVVSYPRLSSA